MTKVLKIFKNGTTNLTTLKTLDELYKSCGFRKSEDFNLIKTFENNNYFFEIWGRISGKNEAKNIYRFFNDKKIDVFGNCLILMKINDEYIDFNIDKWLSKDKIETDNIQLKELDVNNDNDDLIKSGGNIGNSDNSDNDDDDDDYNFNDEELRKDIYIYTSEEEEEEEEKG
jgi:hypothetical protein